MVQKKQGDLRLLRDGVAFGPTDRAELERLLASGRISLTDQVSVCNAEWMPIADYLAASAKNDKPAPVPLPFHRASQDKKGELRVISGSRIIGSLRRDQVEQLRAAGRIDDDELICAANGPWMRIGDFFAPPLVPTAMPIKADAPPITSADAVDAPIEVEVMELEVIDVEAAAPDVMEAELIEPPQSPATRPAYGPEPARPSPPALPPRRVLPQPVSPHASPPITGGYRIAPRRPPAPRSTDEWYVRVRGMYSASLRKHHVKALYLAKEVTRDSLARHGSWHDNDWRPIHSIPQLADIAQESP